MLLNVNKFNLGTRQDGKKLGDVKLPPWASDAADFIATHQRALESEYVSNNLHHWIDLVFGSKQRGQEATEAFNVFFYMTYEGQVDIDAITDPIQQKAALDQIAHFGQTPYQLFKEDHPIRMSVEESISSLFTTPSAVKMYPVDGGSSERASVGQMVLTNESIVMISSLYPYTVTAMDFQANTPDSSGLPFSGKSRSKAFTAISSLSQKLSAVTNLLDTGLSGWSTSLDSHLNFKDCFAISANGRNVFSCGYHDYTIRLCESSNGKSVEVLRGLEQPTCLKLSQCGSILVVGFRNSTVGVWVFQEGLKNPIERVRSYSTMSNMEDFFFNGATFAELLFSSSSSSSSSSQEDRPQRDGARKLILVNTLSFCCGAIKCLDVNTNLDTVVALSSDHELLYHSLAAAKGGSTASSLVRVNNVHADCVMISNESFVVTCNSDTSQVSCFSMNGALLRTASIGDTVSHLEPQVLSHRGRYLALCGSLEKRAHAAKVCCILIYDMLSMEKIFEHELQAYVASCAFSIDDTNLVTVLDDGEVMVFTDPATSLKLVDQMLRLGWQESGLEALQ